MYIQKADGIGGSQITPTLIYTPHCFWVHIQDIVGPLHGNLPDSTLGVLTIIPIGASDGIGDTADGALDLVLVGMIHGIGLGIITGISIDIGITHGTATTTIHGTDTILTDIRIIGMSLITIAPIG